jgi:IS4 transposase
MLESITVIYRLPDGKLIRVLTDRFDLSALSIGQLYKERWTIENWWRWVKQMFKINHYQLKVGSMVIWLEAGSQAKATSPTECG